MSKLKEFNTKCPCGAPLVMVLQKPSSLQAKITKIQCVNCESIFLVTASKELGEYKVGFDIIELGNKAKEQLKKNIDERKLEESNQKGKDRVDPSP